MTDSDWPDIADPDDWREPGGKFVSAERGAGVHGRHNLYTFQSDKLEVWVIKTIVGHQLEGK